MLAARERRVTERSEVLFEQILVGRPGAADSFDLFGEAEFRLGAEGALPFPLMLHFQD